MPALAALAEALPVRGDVPGVPDRDARARRARRPSASQTSKAAVFWPSMRYGFTLFTSATSPERAISRTTDSASSNPPRTAMTEAPKAMAWPSLPERDMPRREHDRAAQAGARRVRARRGGGVAGGRAHHRDGTLLERLRDGDHHAAVLEGAGGVGALDLQPDLPHAGLGLEAGRADERRVPFAEREARRARPHGQMRRVTVDERRSAHRRMLGRAPGRNALGAAYHRRVTFSRRERQILMVLAVLLIAFLAIETFARLYEAFLRIADVVIIFVAAWAFAYLLSPLVGRIDERTRLEPRSCGPTCDLHRDRRRARRHRRHRRPGPRGPAEGDPDARPRARAERGRGCEGLQDQLDAADVPLNIFGALVGGLPQRLGEGAGTIAADALGFASATAAVTSSTRRSC